MVNIDPETIQKLRDYETTMGQLASEIERAERAGIDVTELKAQFVRVETLRSGLIREYGPPPTTRRSGGRRRDVPLGE
jgi:hypothetical protein